MKYIPTNRAERTALYAFRVAMGLCFINMLIAVAANNSFAVIGWLLALIFASAASTMVTEAGRRFVLDAFASRTSK